MVVPRLGESSEKHSPNRGRLGNAGLRESVETEIGLGVKREAIRGLLAALVG